MSTATVPVSMKAYVKDADTPTASVQEMKIPALEPNEVLVKVDYAALNPADWKSLGWFGKPGAIIGSDFAGTVTAVGSDPKVQWAIGDRVAGCIMGNFLPGRGSFAEYTRARSDRLIAVPEGLPLDQASELGIPFYTAAQAVWLSSDTDFPPVQVAGAPWYLVYGGSTAVGLYALQLAKLVGYRPIAVCSPHSFDLVKAYGAEAAFDYKTPAESIKGIKELTGGGVTIGFDTITDDPTAFSLQAFRSDAKGSLMLINAPPMDEVKNGVRVKSLNMFTLFGEHLDFGVPGYVFPADEKEGEFGWQLTKRAPSLITDYGLKTPPLEVRTGFEAIPAGMADLQSGKVSGKRIVFKIA